MNLTEFLTARLDEDEAVARAAGGEMWWPCNTALPTPVNRKPEPRWVVDSPATLVSYEVTSEARARHIAAWSPATVLDEVAAKRRIVAEWNAPDEVNFHHAGDSGNELAWVLKVLALPYASHPDYDEAWRP